MLSNFVSAESHHWDHDVTTLWLFCDVVMVQSPVPSSVLCLGTVELSADFSLGNLADPAELGHQYQIRSCSEFFVPCFVPFRNHVDSNCLHPINAPVFNCWFDKKNLAKKTNM